MKKIKILFIDSEKGHGGASRSLYHMVRTLNKFKFISTVVCKKNSSMSEKYYKDNINCLAYKNIPKLTAVKKETINIYFILKFFLFDWIKSYNFRRDLLSISRNHDIIHFNHINLFLLALWLKRKNSNIKISMHIRTNPYPNLTSKIQSKIASVAVDKFIFITENEYKTFSELKNNNNFSGNVIHNIIGSSKVNKKRFQYLKKNKTFNIGLVSNYSFIRGTDRFVEIILELRKIANFNFIFIFAGDQKISNGDWTKMGYSSKKVINLKNLSYSKGVEKNCIFLDHINNPEDLYCHLDVLIKPTRDNNPWGRDIIEAMSFGLPVISIGKYEKFVNKETGFLMEEYNSKIFANQIKKLMEDNSLKKRLGKNAKRTIQKYCSVKACKPKFESFWESI